MCMVAFGSGSGIAMRPSYRNEPWLDPLGPDTGTNRVMRGGSWDNAAEACVSSHRFPHPPGNNGWYGGFRIVLRGS